MQQRSLFDLEPTEEGRRRGLLDIESEAILSGYVQTYAGQRSRGTLRGEVSQLRSVVRESEALDGPNTLAGVLADLASIVRVLTRPRHLPSAATASRRIAAIQSALLHVHGPEEGRRRIEALDAAMPRRPDTEWHTSGLVVAGSSDRRRPTGPTIGPSDLEAIVAAAGASKREAQALRDRALVAVHCYSGLPAAEIAGLRWSDLRWESEYETWSARSRRRGSHQRLAIFGPAATLLVRLRVSTAGRAEFVFENLRGRPLTDRQSNRIVRESCAAAGFPVGTRTALLSALAAYLSGEGLTDHEVAVGLGVRAVRTVDRLLKPHRSLAGQRLIATCRPVLGS